MEFETMEEAAAYLEAHPQARNAAVRLPIPFPEFEGLTCAGNRDEHLRKLGLILDGMIGVVVNKPAFSRRALDVGASSGLYTWSLARTGYEVVAVEPNPVYAAVARCILRHHGNELAVAWLEGTYSKVDKGGLAFDGPFDAALVLSTFNWMADGGDRMKAACEELREISEAADVMFFEQGFNRGTNCLRTKNPDHLAAIEDLIRENTVYDRVDLLGTTRVWNHCPRHLVLCSRGRNR